MIAAYLSWAISIMAFWAYWTCFSNNYISMLLVWLFLMLVYVSVRDLGGDDNQQKVTRFAIYAILGNLWFTYMLYIDYFAVCDA